MILKSDAIVLGAGIVGVATALQLQLRGRSVVLVDRGSVGHETSYGNGGLIQREAVLPIIFPQQKILILNHALNRRRDTHYNFFDIFGLLPTLYKYWKNGAPEAITRFVQANRPLVEHCLSEHHILAKAAGVEEMLRPGGWIRAFRSNKTRDLYLKEKELAATYGVSSKYISREMLSTLEPSLNKNLVGALQYLSPCSLSNPLALTKAYESLFISHGGKFLNGDARNLVQLSNKKWEIKTAGSIVISSDVLLALGPWSDCVYEPLGYKLPFFVKRGYHMHYEADGGKLNHPVYDVDGGFMLTPMDQGIRLVTGVEFSRRDAKPSPVQLERVEPWARNFFPIGKRLDKIPWMGCRPCLPDMLPIIGKAPMHEGLWFNFGHAHHGLTLAAVTGRLAAEMMTSERPFTDPSPYRIDRFN